MTSPFLTDNFLHLPSRLPPYTRTHAPSVVSSSTWTALSPSTNSEITHTIPLSDFPRGVSGMDDGMGLDLGDPNGWAGAFGHLEKDSGGGGGAPHHRRKRWEYGSGNGNGNVEERRYVPVNGPPVPGNGDGKWEWWPIHTTGALREGPDGWTKDEKTGWAWGPERAVPVEKGYEYGSTPVYTTGFTHAPTTREDFNGWKTSHKSSRPKGEVPAYIPEDFNGWKTSLKSSHPWGASPAYIPAITSGSTHAPTTHENFNGWKTSHKSKRQQKETPAYIPAITSGPTHTHKMHEDLNGWKTTHESGRPKGEAPAYIPAISSGPTHTSKTWRCSDGCEKGDRSGLSKAVAAGYIPPIRADLTYGPTAGLSPAQMTAGPLGYGSGHLSVVPPPYTPGYLAPPPYFELPDFKDKRFTGKGKHSDGEKRTRVKDEEDAKARRKHRHAEKEKKKEAERRHFEKKREKERKAREEEKRRAREEEKRRAREEEKRKAREEEKRRAKEEEKHKARAKEKENEKRNESRHKHSDSKGKRSKKSGEGKKGQGVMIRIPKRVPNFVIRGEDGRVIIVGDDGDVIDSKGGQEGKKVLPLKLVKERGEKLEEKPAGSKVVRWRGDTAAPIWPGSSANDDSEDLVEDWRTDIKAAKPHSQTVIGGWEVEKHDNTEQKGAVNNWLDAPREEISPSWPTEVWDGINKEGNQSEHQWSDSHKDEYSRLDIPRIPGHFPDDDSAAWSVVDSMDSWKTGVKERAGAGSNYRSPTVESASDEEWGRASASGDWKM